VDAQKGLSVVVFTSPRTNFVRVVPLDDASDDASIVVARGKNV